MLENFEYANILRVKNIRFFKMLLKIINTRGLKKLQDILEKIIRKVLEMIKYITKILKKIPEMLETAGN